MTLDETIERFCKLQSKVAEHFRWEYTADCFCHERTLPLTDYRNEGVALAFIEDVVTAALQKRADELKHISPQLRTRLGEIIDEIHEIRMQLGPDPEVERIGIGSTYS